MIKTERPNIDQEHLIAAWQRTLPEFLNVSDQAKVIEDVRNPQLIKVNIESTGRSFYSFEFDVTYVDSREVYVELNAAHKDNQLIVQQTEEVEALIKDYERHIHECAQALQKLTHS